MNPEDLQFGLTATLLILWIVLSRIGPAFVLVGLVSRWTGSRWNVSLSTKIALIVLLEVLWFSAELSFKEIVPYSTKTSEGMWFQGFYLGVTLGILGIYTPYFREDNGSN